MGSNTLRHGNVPATSLTALSQEILEAAADWLVRMQSSEPGVFDQAGLDHWLKASDKHQQAWGLLQQVDRHLDSVPSNLAAPALKSADAQRRRLVAALVVLLGVGVVGVTVNRQLSWQSMLAGHSTRAGERQKVLLADGGVIDLNTATAVDIRYDSQVRLIKLHAGEVSIQTATDKSVDGAALAFGDARPFIVETPQGRIRALGTRFNVRIRDGRTELSVLEHAVEIRPALARSRVWRLEAGQQLSFSETDAGATQDVDSNLTAWTKGMLVVDNVRLLDFLAELERYRSGRIVCAADVADLRVSGAYRTDDIDAVLETLTASHAVELRHFTRYWTRVQAQG